MISAVLNQLSDRLINDGWSASFSSDFVQLYQLIQNPDGRCLRKAGLLHNC